MIRIVLYFGFLFLSWIDLDIKADRLEIIHRWGHAPDIFIQGLAFYRSHQGRFLFYSGGLYGKSRIVKKKLDENLKIDYNRENNLIVFDERNLNPRYFAEGMTILGDRVYQLTWKAGKVLVYDLKLNKLFSHHYDGEGWGLTHDKSYFIRSDGSDQLYFHDFKNFEVVKKIRVFFPNRRKVLVDKINALQYVKGMIYANRWHEDYFLKIDSRNGKVVNQIDAKVLIEDHFPKKMGIIRKSEQVLNGITYDDQKNLFYMSGKNWKYTYAVKIISSKKMNHY